MQLTERCDVACGVGRVSGVASGLAIAGGELVCGGSACYGAALSCMCVCELLRVLIKEQNRSLES